MACRAAMQSARDRGYHKNDADVFSTISAGKSIQIMDMYGQEVDTLSASRSARLGRNTANPKLNIASPSPVSCPLVMSKADYAVSLGPSRRSAAVSAVVPAVSEFPRPGGREPYAGCRVSVLAAPFSGCGARDGWGATVLFARGIGGGGDPAPVRSLDASTNADLAEPTFDAVLRPAAGIAAGVGLVRAHRGRHPRSLGFFFTFERLGHPALAAAAPARGHPPWHARESLSSALVWQHAGRGLLPGGGRATLAPCSWFSAHCRFPQPLLSKRVGLGGS